MKSFINWKHNFKTRKYSAWDYVSQILHVLYQIYSIVSESTYDKHNPWGNYYHMSSEIRIYQLIAYMLIVWKQVSCIIWLNGILTLFVKTLVLFEYPNEHKTDQWLSRISSVFSVVSVYIWLAIPNTFIMQVLCVVYIACRDNHILVLEV